MFALLDKLFCSLRSLCCLAGYAVYGDWQNAYICYAGYDWWLAILAMLVCFLFWLYWLALCPSWLSWVDGLLCFQCG
jgi:hypothetical protein